MARVERQQPLHGELCRIDCTEFAILDVIAKAAAGYRTSQRLHLLLGSSRKPRGLQAALITPFRDVVISRAERFPRSRECCHACHFLQSALIEVDAIHSDPAVAPGMRDR